MIKAENISLIRNNKKILDDVSFETKENEILALIGPNGAGKTSLMNVISGLIKDHSGTVKINNKPIDNYSVDELSYLRSVVSQKVEIDSPFIARDIIMMGLNSNHNDPDNLIIEALELVESVDLIDRNYLDLSGGEQQRIQIARALAQIYFLDDSIKRYLLLDEPTSNLDLSNSFKILSAIKNMTSKNISLIWVVHDINLAIKYADRFLLLKDGKKLSLGNKDDILNKELLSELYGIQLNVFQKDGQSFVLPD